MYMGCIEEMIYTSLSLSVFLVCNLNSANIECMFGLRMHFRASQIWWDYFFVLFWLVWQEQKFLQFICLFINFFFQFIFIACIFSARIPIPTFLKSFYCSVLFSVVTVFLLLFRRYTGTYAFSVDCNANYCFTLTGVFVWKRTRDL